METFGKQDFEGPDHQTELRTRRNRRFVTYWQWIRKKGRRGGKEKTRTLSILLFVSASPIRHGPFKRRSAIVWPKGKSAWGSLERLMSLLLLD